MRTWTVREYEDGRMMLMVSTGVVEIECAEFRQASPEMARFIVDACNAAEAYDAKCPDPDDLRIDGLRYRMLGEISHRGHAVMEDEAHGTIDTANNPRPPY